MTDHEEIMRYEKDGKQIRDLLRRMAADLAEVSRLNKQIMDIIIDVLRGGDDT